MHHTRIARCSGVEYGYDARVIAYELHAQLRPLIAPKMSGNCNGKQLLKRDRVVLEGWGSGTVESGRPEDGRVADCPRRVGRHVEVR